MDAIGKAKKLIHESIAQNLKQVSLTKSFLALAMALMGYFFLLATKIRELEPRLKVAKLFCQWLGGDRILE